MLTTEERIILFDGIREASRLIVVQPDDKHEALVFPTWKRVTHRILQTRGCPCETDQCFLKQSNQELLSLTGKLSFNSFLSILREAKNQFRNDCLM